MKLIQNFLLLVGLSLVGALPVAAQTIAFEGATIYPVSGDPIEDGVLVISGDEISAVGPRSSTRIPRNAQRIDVSGKSIIPGMVDTHSHVGSVQGGDRSSAMHPEVRVLDAVNVMNDNLWRARSGGITTANVMSGSGHLMSGQTVYLKLRLGKTINDLLFCDDVLNGICGGMKMANGTNSIRGDGKFPGTRARSASMARELFTKAVNYKAKLDAGKDVDRDLKMEALIQIMEGKRIVHFHTHRHDDILTALRIGEEFGFTPVLHHVSEGWKVADEVAAAGAPASVIFIDSPGGKLEAIELSAKTGKIMSEAGVDVAFHTDDYISDSRLFLRNAALAVRAGMDEDKALEAMTLAGARMLGMQDQLGSLDEGKDADFVILSGHPFSVYTRVEQTWIEGEKIFDLADPEQEKYANGGYKVYKDMSIHTHEIIDGEWND